MEPLNLKKNERKDELYAERSNPSCRKEYDANYNRQNEASGTKGTKRTKLKLLRRNEAYA